MTPELLSSKYCSHSTAELLKAAGTGSPGMPDCSGRSTDSSVEHISAVYTNQSMQLRWAHSRRTSRVLLSSSLAFRSLQLLHPSTALALMHGLATHFMPDTECRILVQLIEPPPAKSDTVEAHPTPSYGGSNVPSCSATRQSRSFRSWYVP